jgi:hypothetical protein
MKKVNLKQAGQAQRAIQKAFPYVIVEILDWRDSGEGIRLLPHGADPVSISQADIPGLPKGTFLEPGYGSLGLYYI